MAEFKVKVFLSYSHKDEEFREGLEEHLTALKRQGKIEPWCDRKIAPGTNWRQELDAQLNAADIILPLVSSSFVSSEFCYCTELDRAKERHEAGEALIIPIFVRPFDLEALKGTPLQTLQGSPAPDKPIASWGNQDEAFVKVAKDIRKAVEAIREKKQAAQEAMNRPAAIRSPRVPDPFYIERNEAKKLLQRFAAALEQPQANPLLFNLHGIGGVGKTTLLGRLQEAQADNADFLSVCFAKTAGIETPLKLMRKLHQKALELIADPNRADAFSQQNQQFEAALFELSQRTATGEATSADDARKITSWFERFIWQGPTAVTASPRKSRSLDPTGTGFPGLTAIGEDIESWQDWIQQRVRHHPATQDPALQALMLEPVPKLTQAFAASLIQIAQQRQRPLVLVLDTYEKAQTFLNQWLWQHLVEDTPLAEAPVRLLVVGRRSLQADEGWRKLNQDRLLLREVPLRQFSKSETERYLKQIGIEHGRTRDKIYKVTQGLPYYLNWVRKQQEEGNDLDFSRGNQAIAELLLQGIDAQQRQILQIVACCHWFDRATIRYLLGNERLGLQLDAAAIEQIFEWLKGSDFVEFSQGRYRLDDVARDVFRLSYVQDDSRQFRSTCGLLADYFKAQADEAVDPASLLPDPYKDEDWRALTAEWLYYGLFQGKQGLRQYIEQVFVATYLQEPAIFGVPFAAINVEIGEENRKLLPAAADKFFKKSGMVLSFGWLFLDEEPNSYKIKFEGENAPPEGASEALLNQIEASIQSLLGHVGDLGDCLGKSFGLIYKALRCNRDKDKTALLLQAKSQTEQLLTCCRPKLLHDILTNLGYSLLMAKLYEESLDCYQKAVDLCQGNAIAFFGQGNALHDLERYEEALESYQKAIDLDPELVPAWSNQGTTLGKLERYEEALKSFQKAIDLDPELVPAWNYQGDILLLLERYDEALVACDRALKIDPKVTKALNTQALTFSFLKEFDKAITAIDRVIELKPEEALCKANRGIILARAGCYNEALADCEQAIQQNPESVGGYYAKACYHALQGEIEPAIANLQKAIDVAPRRSRSEAKHNPDFDRIRADERFRALVQPEAGGGEEF